MESRYVDLSKSLMVEVVFGWLESFELGFISKFSGGVVLVEDTGVVAADLRADTNLSCFARSDLDNSFWYNLRSMQSCVTPSPMFSFDRTLQSED